MLKTLSLIGGAAALCLFSGCACFDGPAGEVAITRTGDKITVDGKLTEPVWQNGAVKYKLARLKSWEKSPALVQKNAEADPFEGGEVMYACDDEYLYVAILFNDSDIIAQGTENQSHLYSTGDVAEIFLKPADAPHYWELYVSPLGNQTSFFFPSRGYLGLPGPFKPEMLMPGLKTAAAVNGTVNDSTDRDLSWSAEMAIPLKEIAKAGLQFSPAHPWTIMVSRYNYGRGLSEKQYSSYPKLPMVNYHLTEYYAPIIFPGK